MNGRGGEDEGAPGVVSYWEGLVEGPGEGVEVGGVRGGGGGLVSDSQGDGASRVDSSREAKILPLGRFFFNFFNFFFLYQIVIMFKGTKDSCSASYGDKKPISKRHPARFTSS